MSKKPVVLMILDGWGSREACRDNAISQANPSNFISFRDKYPHTLLECSGHAVGLPHGQMGNSEVGHLNMGAGRVVYQEITRISKAIEDSSFYNNKEFLRALEFANEHQGKVHLMGLLSDGGVHSELTHLYALLKLCQDHHIEKVFIHGFLDGRDVAPKSAMDYVNALELKMKEIGVGKIATLGGRFYGMDRDNRWERIEKAYNAIVIGEGIKAATAQAAIIASYEARVTDEFMEPVIIVDASGQSIGNIENGDSIIFFNFRADRARQISHALVDKDMEKFQRRSLPDTHFVCMTQYDADLPASVAFVPQNLNYTLGEVLSSKGLKQLRIAETEKYAHVTFFFNGGVEEANPGEDRILIPSPKVVTYNLKPEMSAREITERTLTEMDRDFYDVIIINYANADMIGHTGILPATIEAIKVVDECLARIVERVIKKEGLVMITADHGNAEKMICPETGSPFTAHTLSKVPFVLISESHKGQLLSKDGSLRDIAPTLLSIMGIEIPKEMTGVSLLNN
ncbi:MAG: 2,3-bisphosphoglycerate-independent phosphoglycerate mutase [Firmicutes bacterium HGW-Firmicutes-15]|nr:MAG: 2,3-bisphosphoglycerate-independent phosphoglycerate mutase [Firmicutes bacterium HGW-Firmicutes-15]